MDTVTAALIMAYIEEMDASAGVHVNPVISAKLISFTAIDLLFHPSSNGRQIKSCSRNFILSISQMTV